MVNWDKEVQEIPEEEQLKRLKEAIKERKGGSIEIWRKKYEYKGIAFELAILRHFNSTGKFTPVGNRSSDRYVIVECPEESKKVSEAVDSLYHSKFLNYNSLDSGLEGQTLEEQLEEAYNWATEDISSLPIQIEREINYFKFRIDRLQRVLGYLSILRLNHRLRLKWTDINDNRS